MERDLEAFVRLRALNDPTPLTVEELKIRWAAYQDRLLHGGFVAEVFGAVVGYARWARFHEEKPGVASVSVAVDPEFQQQGIGSNLLKTSMESMLANGIHSPFGGTDASRERSVRFAQNAGFEQVQTYHEMECQLGEREAFEVEAARAHLFALGLAHHTLTISDEKDSQLADLYDLFAEADADEPFTASVGVANFETFCQKWALPEVQAGRTISVREPNGNVVGMTYYSCISDGSSLSEFTGVRRAWRGKGVAAAMKLLILEIARMNGVRSMHTSNSSMNPAMLKINRTLGFQSKYDWMILEKQGGNH
ncbi:MAG: GNAT family N-acetyltransferase [Armatimonadetes bacterium]|nr:GNAT family N-acetyltransferase [Armatimonadota bacterium]